MSLENIETTDIPQYVWVVFRDIERDCLQREPIRCFNDPFKARRFKDNLSNHAKREPLFTPADSKNDLYKAAMAFWELSEPEGWRPTDFDYEVIRIPCDPVVD